MKARTLGPALMIALGAVTLVSPTFTSVSASEVDPCTAPQAGVDPCCDASAIAVVDTTEGCDTTTTTGDDGSGAGIPDAGGNTATTIALGVALLGGGGALIFTTRRRPKTA